MQTQGIFRPVCDSLQVLRPPPHLGLPRRPKHGAAYSDHGAVQNQYITEMDVFRMLDRLVYPLQLESTKFPHGSCDSEPLFSPHLCLAP